MPSTEYFGATLVNLGPLTTTFTEAPSCTAESFNYYVQDPDLSFILYRPSCDAFQPRQGCAASVSKQSDLVSSYFNGGFKSKYYNLIEYYSPASICPKGWTTAGTAASASSGAEVKATGVLNVGDWPPSDAPDLPALELDYARQANRWLKPGETMVWCCPQDYDADKNGMCWSTIGAYDPTAKGQEALSTIYECEVPSTYTVKPNVATVTSFDGTTWDPPILSWEAYEPVTGSPAPAPTDDEVTYRAVVATAAMMLVSGGDGNRDNGDNDNEDGGDGESSDNKEDKDNNDKEEESNDEEDGAMALNPKGVVSMGAMAVALMAGAGVFSLW